MLYPEIPEGNSPGKLKFRVMAKSVRTPMPAPIPPRLYGGNPDDRPRRPRRRPKGRLGNGQLRRQVAEYLTDHPGPCKTGEIARALDRSAGAVGNALTTLAGRGEADLLPGKPIRYQANSATAAAAAAIAPKAPLPPGRPRPQPAAPAAPAPAPSPAPSRPAGCGRPGHPPERPGLPAEVAGRHARRRGPAQAARRRACRPCCTGRPVPARPA